MKKGNWGKTGSPPPPRGLIEEVPKVSTELPVPVLWGKHLALFTERSEETTRQIADVAAKKEKKILKNTKRNKDKSCRFFNQPSNMSEPTFIVSTSCF